MTNRLAETQAQIAETQTHLVEAQAQLADTQTQLVNTRDNLTGQILTLQTEIQNIYKSTGWKITKPMRDAKNLFLKHKEKGPV